jgi:transcriptional regulator with XRE-family HTH domain
MSDSIGKIPQTPAPASPRMKKSAQNSDETLKDESASGLRPDLDPLAIGIRLRKARQDQKLGLREMARRLQVSPSLISLIERGRASPSVGTLYAMVTELDLSLDELFSQGQRSPGNGSAAGGSAESADVAVSPEESDDVNAQVVREDQGPTINLGSGVHWERLTRRPDPDVEFLHATYEVGGASTDGALMRHAGKEFGRVLQGRLGVTVGFETYELGPGDSIAFESMIPHRLWNLGEEPVHVVWFVTGRRGDPRVEDG